MKRQGNHAPYAHLLAWLLDAAAVEANVAFADDRLRKGPTLREPDEEEEPVDPHFFLSLASSAKA